MFIKRFLYVTGENLASPLEVCGPFATKDEAKAYSRLDFEDLVLSKLGETHTIPWNADKSMADYDETEIYTFDNGAWSWYDGADESFYGQILETKIKITTEELWQAYNEHNRHYRTLDATERFLNYVGYNKDKDADDPDNVDADLSFCGKYGFHISDAIREDSELYLIEELVRTFYDNFSVDIAEYDQWQNAIEKVLDSSTIKN